VKVKDLNQTRIIKKPAKAGSEAASKKKSATKMRGFSKSGIKNLMKKSMSSGQRLDAESKTAMVNAAEAYVREVSRKAATYAANAKRSTIKAEDVNAAANLYE